MNGEHTPHFQGQPLPGSNHVLTYWNPGPVVPAPPMARMSLVGAEEGMATRIMMQIVT